MYDDMILHTDNVLRTTYAPREKEHEQVYMQLSYFEIFICTYVLAENLLYFQLTRVKESLLVLILLYPSNPSGKLDDL